MNNEDKLESDISAAQKVAGFLEDPVIDRALRELHEQQYRDFRAAKTPDEIMAAHAAGVALDAFAGKLKAIVDRGVHARHELDRSTPRNRRGTAQKA